MHKLLHSADVAIFITNKMADACGIAWIGPYGRNTGVVDYSCAKKGHTLSHEIGHIFGAEHNEEAYNEPNEIEGVANNNGFLMRPPKKSGKRTIMA